MKRKQAISRPTSSHLGLSLQLLGLLLDVVGDLLGLLGSVIYQLLALDLGIPRQLLAGSLDLLGGLLDLVGGTFGLLLDVPGGSLTLGFGVLGYLLTLLFGILGGLFALFDGFVDLLADLLGRGDLDLGTLGGFGSLGGRGRGAGVGVGRVVGSGARVEVERLEGLGLDGLGRGGVLESVSVDYLDLRGERYRDFTRQLQPAQLKSLAQSHILRDRQFRAEQGSRPQSVDPRAEPGQGGVAPTREELHESKRERSEVRSQCPVYTLITVNP